MIDEDWQALAWLTFFWLTYFAVHSLLAALPVKRWVALHYPQQMPLYRLGFNIFAVLSLLPILWLTLRHPGSPLWAWQGLSAWLANGLALAALLGFARSLRDYDGKEFLGWRQWKAHTQRIEDQERFHLSPFHRYVRHPWYFFALLLIWTRDMNSATFLSSVLMTLYFIIGSRLEEAKLLTYHGEVYRRYMQQVAGLIPLPWKILTVNEAAALVKAAARLDV